MSVVNFTSVKSLIVVTGASKGIGKTIAVELSKQVCADSVFVLLARSKSGLEATKAEINNWNKTVTVLTFPVDFSKPDLDSYTNIFSNILTNINDVKLSIIFHNAGQVGSLKQTTDLTNLLEWREYFDMNLFSVSLLNSVFVSKLRTIIPKLMVVNITSLCGRIPFENMAMYGSGKAARELFFKVFAVEEPNILVLNYSPGPVDTDMYNGVAETAQSEAVRKNFTEGKKTILSTLDTVGKLLGILEKEGFKSGDTIDYFD